MALKKPSSVSMKAMKAQKALLVWARRLPGWQEFLDGDPKAKKWIEEYDHRVNAAIEDEDVHVFERALGTWIKAWDRVNERVAEQFRQGHPDAVEWPLTYLRYMVHVEYILFGSRLGDFRLYPRPPKEAPPIRWYIVDQMISMLHPDVANLINSFGVLPVQPSSLERAGPGEKILRVDCTEDPIAIKYDFPGSKP